MKALTGESFHIASTLHHCSALCVMRPGPGSPCTHNRTAVLIPVKPSVLPTVLIPVKPQPSGVVGDTASHPYVINLY